MRGKYNSDDTLDCNYCIHMYGTDRPRPLHLHEATRSMGGRYDSYLGKE